MADLSVLFAEEKNRLNDWLFGMIILARDHEQEQGHVIDVLVQLVSIFLVLQGC